MKLVEEGETANEAIENALEKHGLVRDEVRAEIIDKGRKGFLGFWSKPAKIELEIIKLSAEEKSERLIKRIIDKMGFSATVDTKKNGDRIFIDVTSKNASRLIGRRGETLFAIEHILNKAISLRKDEKLNVEIDIDSYRRKRAVALKKMAENAVEKAKKSGKPSSLPPLFSKERLVVYNYLKKISGVSARSRGKGNFKKIVISPAGINNAENRGGKPI